MANQSADERDADRGVSAWVLAAVVVVVVGLVAYPAWWLLDSLLGDSSPANTESTTKSVPTTGTTIPVPVVNLALGRPATGSGPGSDPPTRLVDGDTTRGWNSGSWPPQVVEIDLEAPSTVYEIRMLTGQNPNGETQHIVFGWYEGETEPVALHIFDGYTTDRQWLEYEPEEPWVGIERIAVGSAVSPSWVAWFEIEVIGTTP